MTLCTCHHTSEQHKKLTLTRSDPAYGTIITEGRGRCTVCNCLKFEKEKSQ